MTIEVTMRAGSAGDALQGQQIAPIMHSALLSAQQSRPLAKTVPFKAALAVA